MIRPPSRFAARRALVQQAFCLAAGLALASSAVSQAGVPVITSFSPAGGPGGTAVSLRGLSFTGATAVRFNGTDASFTVGSDTLVTAYVPGPATAGPISVTNEFGTGTSAANFFVGNPPTVYGFVPYAGPVGTSVLISGNYFAGTTQVEFNGRPAVFLVNSNTVIQATVPSGVTSGPVRVTNPAGSATSPGYFYPPPVVTSFAPSGGPAGTAVTIYGLNLGIVNTVYFNEVAATSFSVQTNDRLVAYVPGGAASGPIRLTSPAGSGYSTSSFYVGSAPVVTGFSPAGGPLGTVVTIVGTDLLGATAVTFGGVFGAYTVEAADRISAIVPAAGVSGRIEVTTPAGTGTSPTDFFVGDRPVIAGFFPPSASVGDDVVVTGSGFVGTSEVRFGSAAASLFSVDAPTQITAVVPFGAKAGPITVINPAGIAISGDTFYLAPSIYRFWPACVSSRSLAGTQVRVEGADFTGALGVQFGTTSVPFVIESDTSIVATLTAEVRSGPILVSTAVGTGASPVDFEVAVFDKPPRTGWAVWPADPTANVPVSTSGASEVNPAVASDSVGGAFVAWQDSRSGGWDLYLQRVTAYGEIAPGWPAGGLPICVAGGHQIEPVALADGSGGVIVVWKDYRAGNWDLYALRVKADATPAPGWTPNGVAVCVASGEQDSPRLISDGGCGAYFTWTDLRDGNWDIYAQRLLPDGTLPAGWSPNGQPVCRQGNNQYSPGLAEDGYGGVFIVWRDERQYGMAFAQRLMPNGLVAPSWPQDGMVTNNNYTYQYSARVVASEPGTAIVGWEQGGEVFATKITSTGSTAVGWVSSGRNLSNSGSCSELSLVPDGKGGAIALFRSNRSGNYGLFAQRVTSVGQLAAGWNFSGIALRNLLQGMQEVSVTPDGLGGAIACWADYRSGVYDIYGQRVFGSGSVPTGWPENGTLVCGAAGHQYRPAITGNGKGGAVVSWYDARSGSTEDVYAQNLDFSGRLGNPEPILTSVRDLPVDQGGRVRVAWSGSPLDTIPTLEISAYGIWRLVTESYAAALAAQGKPMRLGPVAAEDAQPGVLRALRVDGVTTYWEGVGSVLARGLGTYTFVAETFEDSTAYGNPPTRFMVDAHASFGPFFWDSNPDSGYSVDNLAPAMPANLVGRYEAGTMYIHWSPNSERDFSAYRIHRGAAAAFVPGPENLVATRPDTGYADPAGSPFFYKLAAMDEHGNLGPWATLFPDGTVDAGEGVAPSHLWLGAPRPNPVVAGRAAVRFGLPSSGRVRVTLYDTSGRSLGTLVDGDLEAGEHAVEWSGRDGDGRQVRPGIYFLRLEAGGRVLQERIAVLR